MKRLLIAFVTVLAACTPPDQSPGEATLRAGGIAPEITNIVEAAMPGIFILGGQQDGEGEYEVTGILNGEEYEFDLLGPEGGWRIAEIQRDIEWANAPASVRDRVATSPNAFLPDRVIESQQPADGSVVYELFASSAAPGVPTLEVRYMDGEAAILPPAH